MAIATFWKEDEMPTLPAIDGVRAEKTFDIPLLINITGLSKMEIERRFSEQHDAWILLYGQLPVAFGWVARAMAPVGELECFLRMPAGQVYFWNFRTLQPWRGKGFYPVLLQMMIRHEMAMGTEKIWILTAPENQASIKGVQKAGFTLVGELAYNEQNNVVLSPVRKGERADAAAHFFNTPVVHTELKPCWCCNSKRMRKANGTCACQCNKLQEQVCDCSLH